MLAWRDVKLAHKRLVSRLLQCRAHLIFCLRAEEKIKFVKDDKTGKMRIEPAGWLPICEKNFMYEMTVSFMLGDDRPGHGRPIKLQEQHKPCFAPNTPLDESAGHQLAAWAAGGAGDTQHTTQPGSSQRRREAEGSGSAAPAPSASPEAERTTLVAEIVTLLDELKATKEQRTTWKTTYLGSAGADPRAADIAALTDYAKFLRHRAEKKTA